MIKKGDKVVCIKDYITETKSSEIGNIYSVDYISDFSTIVLINSCVFYIRNKISDNDLYFYDYFATLAEWREKQIKSILDG